MQMQINILKVRQGVYMGDHAETIDNAVYVEPTKTIQELVESELFYIEEGRLLYDKGECDCPKGFGQIEHHELYCGIWVVLDLTGLRGFDELINQYSNKEF